MDEISTYPTLAALKNKVQWETPDEYFEEFPAKILAKIAIEEHISLQKNIEPVEDSYFDSFFSRLKTRIENEENEPYTPILDAIPKDTIWEVPAGYFDNFANKMTEVAEDKNIAPMLFSLEKKEELVPDGYFEALPHLIFAKIKHQEKVITFVPNWWSKARNYGIGFAATVALFLAGMWILSENNQTKEADYVPNFAHISTQELEQAIEEEYIEDELLAEVLPVNYDTKTAQDLPAIDEISEEELIKYLEKEGEL